MTSPSYRRASGTSRPDPAGVIPRGPRSRTARQQASGATRAPAGGWRRPADPRPVPGPCTVRVPSPHPARGHDSHEGTRLRRRGPPILDRRPRPGRQGPRRRDRAGRRGHHLRHRPAHPQGRRARGRVGSHPRARGGRHGPRGRRPRARHPRRATACWSPASPPAGGAATARRATTASASAAAAGCSATPSTAPRPSSVRVPFADHSLHVLPENVSDEDALMLADILPTSYEVGVLAGRVSPGDTVVVVGAGPIGLAALMTARLFSPSRVVDGRPRGAAAPAARWSRAPTTPSVPTGGPAAMVASAHRRARRGRGDRGGRRARQLRAVHRAGAARRARGQRRRARRAGDPPPRDAVDQGRHHHHRPGRHPDHARCCCACSARASST